MKTRYILFAFAALAMSACARNVEPAEPEGLQVTVTASLEGNDPTRTTVQDGGTQVYWETAEEIKVFFRNSIGRFISQNTEQARTADFTGSFSAVVGSNEGEASSHLIWGLYPFRADATYDGSSVTTTLPSAQTGRAGSFAKNTNITIAQSVGLNLAFYNVCGGLRFSLTQEGIKRITFEGNNGEALAGKIKIAFEDGVPVVSEVVAKDGVLTLTAPDGGTFQTGAWYYISAIPGTLSGGYKMVFYKDNESAKLTSTSSVRIKRGIFGSLADADEDLVFKPTGGGDEPNPEDVIQFADPAAKYACVAMFDTDGDGEVSIEEAEAATSFNGLFANWKGVKCFDEIIYFKNVHSLDGVFNGCDKLVSITIPENITDLGYKAFSDCSSLTSILLPSGITYIGNYTFQNCSQLSSIVIPSNVTSIGEYAFYGCRRLSSIDIPSNVTSIGQYAFYHCGSLSQIVIPDRVTSIGQYAFCYCGSLTQIVIPNGVTSIPAYCFQNCSSLSSISIPEGVTYIGERAFYGVNMWKLELPVSISSLGKRCFGDITCVLLPSTSQISIQPNTFNGVSGIFVPSNMMGMYAVMTNWTNYSSRLHPLDSYREKTAFTLITEGSADMGTSVKWAAYNVGASTPEEYGDYYAWGEIQTKSFYSLNNYKWSNGDVNTLTKYCYDSSYGYNGFTDNKTTLDMEDDAARANWGGNWRMPTTEEWQELADCCYMEWAIYNDINGRMIYSFGSGNQIFFPAAGNGGYGSYIEQAGFYWLADLNEYTPDSANYFAFFSSDIHSFPEIHRPGGLSIRPVCE